MNVTSELDSTTVVTTCQITPTSTRLNRLVKILPVVGGRNRWSSDARPRLTVHRLVNYSNFERSSNGK
jgi:hypothetical protein